MVNDLLTAIPGDFKRCTKCLCDKARSEFYPDNRKADGLRTWCKACHRANIKATGTPRTPAQKAEYARRTGTIDPSIPYIGREVRSAFAAEKRAERNVKLVARKAELSASAEKRNEWERLATAGSNEWLTQATEEQIRTLRIAEAKIASRLSDPPKTCLIALSGKDAVDEYAFATIDVDDYQYLSRWAWKAKWNGSRSGIYAVRNTIINGRWITIRMHREVLGIGGFDGALDVDHHDWDTLNNSVSNLRVLTRSQNVRHRSSPSNTLAADEQEAAQSHGMVSVSF